MMLPPDRDQLAPTALSAREQTIELLVVLLLIVPGTLLAFLVRGAAGTPVPFTLQAVATMSRDLALLALVWLLVRRGGQTGLALGWSRERLGTEVGVGVLLFPAMFVVGIVVEQLALALGASGPSAVQPSLVPAPSAGQVVLAVLLVCVVAVSEETLFRGYLVLRLQGATGSIAWALAGSTVLFALGHGYEGLAGMLGVGAQGLLLAVVYVWRERLTAPITMHLLQDLLVLVLLPALTRSGG